MLGIFPKAFPQGRYSQVATSQMCNFPNRNFPKVRLCLLRRRKAAMGAEQCDYYGLGRPSAAARTGCGPNAASRTDWGSCRLGNFTFGKFLLGKIALGSYRLGKYLTPHRCQIFKWSLLLDSQIIFMTPSFDPWILYVYKISIHWSLDSGYI